jgi:hypothetical protein
LAQLAAAAAVLALAALAALPPPVAPLWWLYITFVSNLVVMEEIMEEMRVSSSDSLTEQ